MKKILLAAFTFLLSTSFTCAIGVKPDSYFDRGIVYSGSSFPQSTANNINDANLKNLKKGEAMTINYLGFVEIGNASIKAAAKEGGITKIHYVDTHIEKAYAPLFFLPIYVKGTKTIVYGE